MIVLLHKNFKKQYKKLRSSEKEKFKERRNLFVLDQFSSILNNHALHGEYAGYRSINITGDLRVFYEPKDKDVVQFLIIDTHSNLF